MELVSLAQKTPWQSKLVQTDSRAKIPGAKDFANCHCVGGSVVKIPVNREKHPHKSFCFGGSQERLDGTTAVCVVHC